MARTPLAAFFNRPIVILSPWRRICAQSEPVPRQPDPSMDLGLSPFDCAQGRLVEWAQDDLP